jgi:hypothetical protein
MRSNREQRESTEGPLLEIEEFKQFLGSTAEQYTEEELQLLRYEFHEMAEILLDLYLARKERDRDAGSKL